MLFHILQQRLLDIAREKVRTGEWSESALARLTGISQPHMHNILKGIRGLSPEIADQMLNRFNLTVADLYTPEELWTIQKLETRLVPTLESGRFYPFPAALVASLQDPAVFVFPGDPLMLPRFQPGDTLLINRSPRSRLHPEPSSPYLVKSGGEFLIRYIRLGARRIYLASERSLEDPPRWQSLMLHRTGLLSLIEGRIVWVGRNIPV